MSDKMRWRYGDTNPVVAAVAAATVIEIGDLLWQDTDNAKPAALCPTPAARRPTRRRWSTSSWAWPWRGAARARPRRSAWPPRACSSWTARAKPSSWATWWAWTAARRATPLLNQQAIKVGSSALAIGRVAKRQPVATTSVLVDIRSTVMTGGVAGGSSSGAL